MHSRPIFVTLLLLLLCSSFCSSSFLSFLYLFHALIPSNFSPFPLFSLRDGTCMHQNCTYVQNENLRTIRPFPLRTLAKYAHYPWILSVYIQYWCIHTIMVLAYYNRDCYGAGMIGECNRAGPGSFPGTYRTYL